MSVFDRFQESPFGPLGEHIAKVKECVVLIEPMFECVRRKDFAGLKQISEQVFKKVQGCSQRFLNHELNWLGFLPEDNSVEGAVLKRQPFCQAFPDSVATRYLKKLASSLERYLPNVPSASM